MAAGDMAWSEAMDAGAQEEEWEDNALASDAPRELRAAREAMLARAHRVVADDLYGSIPVSQWAQSLLELAPFRRLDGVSLSDVPGEMLFGWPFPSRLTHSLGVYYLARQARPRDRALQAAALAHDLGHGPFSHLIEPLMVERLGKSHEDRSAELLRAAVLSAQGRTARLLAWLDVDEVSALIAGKGSDGRGELLNGLLDYDNLDHVARFALAAKFCAPGYDGRALARGLRVISGVSAGAIARVALADEMRDEAQAWRLDRTAVFQFLQSDTWNVAAHSMLRKAIDLAVRDSWLDDTFFDETDDGALRLLRRFPSSRPLVELVLARKPYTVIWEADTPPELSKIENLFKSWRKRLALEERIAAESGLRTHEVVAAHVVSRVARALPPFISQTLSSVSEPMDSLIQDHSVRILAPTTAGQDYIRRARMAAERALGGLGVILRGWPELQ
jgi:HD superfamily phosphohydrolase